MASNATKKQVLTLYRCLIRESKKFHSYNFRMYALRRIHDSFRQHKCLEDPEAITNQIFEGKRNLDIIKRQVIIDGLYTKDTLVIENVKTN